MANENIQIADDNFCVGPQVDTFATIDQSEASTRLLIKDETGTTLRTYTLSTNIIDPIVSIEYTGPRNLTDTIQDATFFTCEKINTTKCVVRKWEIDNNINTLNLKQSFTLQNSAPRYYDAIGFAVEHYEREFGSVSLGNLNFLTIDDADRLENGMKLFLGPNFADETETVQISFIVGNTVHLTSNLINEYSAGDAISFYKNFYVVSSKGYNGDTSQGSILIHDARTGNPSTPSIINGAEYKNTDCACWSSTLDSVLLAMGTQAIFIRPYDSWQKWRSMYLNNVEEDNKTIITVRDIVSLDLDIYKLMRKATYRDDNGNATTYSWSNYNYQPDSLIQYTSAMTVYADKYILKPEETTTLTVRVTNQFGFSLSNKQVNFFKSGDPGSSFDPPLGQGTTDTQGYFSVDYTSGETYDNVTDITVEVDGSLVSARGSTQVWNSLKLYSDSDFDAELGEGTSASLTEPGRGGGLTTFGYVDYGTNPSGIFIESSPGDTSLFQIRNEYKTTHADRTVHPISLVTDYPPIYLTCKTYFTFPAGEIEPAGGDWQEDYVGNYDATKWPLQELPGGGRNDGPPTTWDWQQEPYDTPISPPTIFNLRASFIKQVGELRYDIVPGSGVLQSFDTEKTIRQDDRFRIYRADLGATGSVGAGVFPPYFLTQKGYVDYSTVPSGVYIAFDSEGKLDQNKLSFHTHYVDGVGYDYLWTYEELDQFIFVQEAIPAFFSEKNNTNTSIYIRLNPFAFDLNGDPYDPTYPFRFYIREVWTEEDVIYDTGYYDVAKEGTVTTVSGTPAGIEFFYQTPTEFHHDAIIYVHLEIYDKAPSPNFITTDYWFKIIPDFNRPYLENLSPVREQDQVPVDTNIYFEIKDDGAGININTLEVFLNSRIITPTNIEEVSKYHYKITIDLPSNLLYDKVYAVAVTVRDVSPNQNRLRDAWRFYTAESEAPWFVDFDPRLCHRGMPRFKDVSVKVLGLGDGVDPNSIRMQVHQKDVTNKLNLLPIIYRIS